MTILGTLLCIGVAFAIDGYSFDTGTWTLGERAINNLLIPMLLAPPLLFLLLSKLRELAIAHQELPMTIAATDGLTQCPNRRAFTAIVETRKVPPDGALVVVDADHFKSVNDTFGHEAGDKALQTIANTLRAEVRGTDIVGRRSREEFSVFLPGATLDATGTIFERVRTAIGGTPFGSGDRTHRISVSAGGVVFARPASFSELYRFADEQLYTAKDSGRDRCVFAVLDITGHARGAP